MPRRKASPEGEHIVIDLSLEPRRQALYAAVVTSGPYDGNVEGKPCTGLNGLTVLEIADAAVGGNWSGLETERAALAEVVPMLHVQHSDAGPWDWTHRACAAMGWPPKEEGPHG